MTTLTRCPSGFRPASDRRPRYTCGLTTYLAVVDKDHNMVSITSSLLSLFGSGMVVENAGYFLNNRMAYFYLDPSEVPIRSFPASGLARPSIRRWR